MNVRLRSEVSIFKQWDDFMSRKRTTDVTVAPRLMMEKSRKGQKELNCVFVDQKKVYDRIQKEELWFARGSLE